MMDYEETMAFLGQWGWFQQIIFFFLCTSAVPNGFSAFSVIFLADIPAHYCQIPGRNLTDEWIKASIPTKVVNGKLELNKCWRYKLEVIQNLSFDLVCDSEWKQPFTSTIYFVGEVFSVLFFIVGLGQISNYVRAFVLGSEILPGAVRVFYSSLGITLFFSIGYMMLPLIAFLMRNWRMVLIALSIPGLIYIPLWCKIYSTPLNVLYYGLIPESPRWLISQGRIAEAKAILKDAAKKNEVTAPEIIFKETGVQSKSVLDLMRTRNIRQSTLILFLDDSQHGILWSLNTSRLHGAPYVNCFISAAVEVPGYIISWLSLQYLPRRLSCSTSMLLGGGVLFFIQLVPPNLPSLSVALEMTGKFGIAMGTALMFAYTGELYPTVLRNTAVGSCAMVSHVGSAIAPYFINLNVYHKYLPYIILGSLRILSLATTLFLPENFRNR
uniref:Major facilitator superfamily (MFS) profile domain-containing protein n=1 Tax=Electrophorus electricus TaxID=8005 RepID=A0AAY5E7W3_ELEEL